jgi:eukaryotic-like serine/threonine-protein kinase
MPILDKDRWASLRALLEQALELAPESRAAWLAEREREDPALAAELEALLAAEPELDRQGFLAELDREELLAERPSLAGQRIGSYTLETPLGRGGMGSVWLARRTDGRFEGEVAIKLLNLALLGPVGEARFRREGTLLARLTHPNIARLIDAGVTEAAQPYLLLERVDGRPLDEYCEAEQLSPLDRVRLFHQLLDAVAHAHAHFIVHRDLKPSNILVTGKGVPKLLDFGIAKLLDDGKGRISRSILVETGAGAFTPEYAAPEQVRGEPVSAATDVYSLGVLLYRLLAGRHPTSEGCRTPADHMHAILDIEPTRLSDAVTESAAAAVMGPPHRLRRLYLGDLDNILARSLRKNPAERYPTAAALAADLGRYIRDEPMSARPESLRYRATGFVRRHLAGVAAAAVSLLTMVGGTVYSVWQLVEARHQRDEARFQERRADAQLAFQNLVFSSIGDRPITMREMLDRGKTLLEREYVGEARLGAAISQMLALQYGEIGAYDAAEAMLARSDSLARRSGASGLLLQNSCRRALYLSNTDRAVQAHALLDSVGPALAIADPVDLPDCLLAQAEIATADDRPDSAVALSRRAIALLDQQGDTAAIGFVNALNTLANALEHSSHRREALSVYQRIAGILDRNGRGETTFRSVISNDIGIALTDLGQLVEAAPVLRATVEQFGRSNPAGEVRPVILVAYARTLLGLQVADSAADWSSRLRSQAARDGNAVLEQTGLYFLVQADLLRGRLEEAAAHLEDFKRLIPRLSRPKQEDVLELEGRIAQARGDSRGANDKFVAALRASGYFDGKPTYGTRSLLLLAAGTALDLAKPVQALGYARASDSLAAEDSVAVLRSAYVGEARLLEACALLVTGDTVGARSAVGSAVTALTAGAGPRHPLTLQADSLRGRLAG